MCVIIVAIGFFTDYTAHISMNKNHGVPYGKVTFEEFLCEWEKKKDHPEIEIRDKYAAINFGTALYLWANIIQFDKKCMIFSPLGWLKYRLWERRTLCPSWKPNGKTGKWSDLKQN